jgi:hypothetical protein
LSPEPEKTDEFAFNSKESSRTSSSQLDASILAPNPTSTTSTLKVKGSGSANSVVRVFNLAGMEAMPSMNHAASLGHSFDYITLNSARLIPGCYLVRIETEVSVETLRWVIDR